jgi:hypothetical protein
LLHESTPNSNVSLEMRSTRLTGCDNALSEKPQSSVAGHCTRVHML